jgi:hypothetical protein
MAMGTRTGDKATQTAAYREAYTVGAKTKDGTVHGMASQLMLNPQITDRIDELIAQRDRALIRSQVADKDIALKVFRNACDPHQQEDVTMTMMKGAENLAKTQGMFINTEQRIDPDRDLTPAQVTAELDAMIEEAKATGTDDNVIPIDKSSSKR